MPPYGTEYPALNAANVVPQADELKERWPAIMEKWGSSMKNAYVVCCEYLADVTFMMVRSVEGLAQMAAIGLGLSRETFTDAGRYGYLIRCPSTTLSC